MTHSPADVLRALLVDRALIPAGWAAFATHEPDSPDNCVTCYDTVGNDHGRSMPDGEVMGHVGVQIRVRGTTQQVARTRADALFDAAATVYDWTVHVDDARYNVHALVQIGDVIPLGKDKPTGKRSLFTINALMIVEEL